MNTLINVDGKKIHPAQTGIPLPPRPGGQPSPTRSAIEELEPNESRLFTGYTSKQLVQTCASIRKKYPERRYAVRGMGEAGLFVRVWRSK